MKAWIFLSVLFVSVMARAEDFGVGVILGDPTGLSVKMKLDDVNAIDGALAYSSGRYSGLQFHGDYLWNNARSWHTEQGPLSMFYGLGGRVISYRKDDTNEVSVGPRGSIGAQLNISNPNLEIFGELALVLDLAPRMAADLDAGVGVRIRF